VSLLLRTDQIRKLVSYETQLEWSRVIIALWTNLSRRDLITQPSQLLVHSRNPHLCFLQRNLLAFDVSLNLF
jgi:hypothetical protein